MEIRAIRDDEADALGALTVRVYESIGATDEEYTPELRDVRGRVAGGCAVLVAIAEDGALAGGMTYVPGPGRWADRAADDEAELRMLAVDPRHRRQGIGSALVQRCVAMARAEGRRRLVLLTEDFMADAQRIYLRIGFVRTPARDWAYKPGVHLMAYVLEL